MGSAKIQTVNGVAWHVVVGALIERDGTFLLIDRAIQPFGFAGPAGHVDEGETLEEALRREVREEVGLSVTRSEPLFAEKRSDTRCAFGLNNHDWHLYSCKTIGEVTVNFSEAKSSDWYTSDEIKDLPLEPVWKYWFQKLSVIPT